MALLCVLAGSSGADTVDTSSTSRVSVDSSGNQTDDFADSTVSDISEDGRYVTFVSSATNLVPDDTNGFPDVFVRDLQTGTTERVSVSSSGDQANSSSGTGQISSDGRYVIFGSSATNLVADDTSTRFDIFVHDRQTESTERVNVDSSGNEANNISSGGDISDDGRYVAFSSTATNLVAGDTNRQRDTFVHDRQTGTTERVSVNNSGNQVGGGSSL